MSKRLSLIALAAAAAFALVTPAFAQSFSGSTGTGNVLPTYYDQGGVLRHGVAPQLNQQFATQPSGLNAYASIRHHGVHHRQR